MNPNHKILIAFAALFLIAASAFFVFQLKIFETAVAPERFEIPPVTEEPKGPARLLFTGDIMLSRSVGAKMAAKGDYGYPARKVEDFFRNADIVAVNLEGPMSDEGVRSGSEYSFRADPRAVETLKLLNASVVSLANNHMWDYGRAAMMDTIEILSENNIVSAGAGGNARVANAPAIRETKGMKFHFFAYTNLYPKSLEAGENSPGVSSFVPEKAYGEIQAIKSADPKNIVIVLFHWGEEYEPHPNAFQRDTAHALVDAGADMVIGHHPHVAQDAEEYKGKHIFYSLGNFIFDQYFSEETMRGLVVEAFAENGRITDVKLWQSSLNPEYGVESIVPYEPGT